MVSTPIFVFVSVTGKQYYVFSANELDPRYPRPLTDLGLPATLTHIDGAMVWGYNGKTYLFSGTMYWRLDEDVGTVELDYPRDMSMWRGVGYNIDAVFQWKDGKVHYSFKQSQFSNLLSRNNFSFYFCCRGDIFLQGERLLEVQ